MHYVKENGKSPNKKIVAKDKKQGYNKWEGGKGKKK